MHTPFRIKTTNICLVAAGAFQSRHEARVDRPLDDLDLAELFRDVQGNLQVGDEVTLVAYRDSTWRQVMEVGVLRVIGKPHGLEGLKTSAAWIGEIYRLPDQVLAPATKKEIAQLGVRKEFGGGFVIHDQKGHVLERTKTRKEAEDYVARLAQAA